MAGTSSSIPTKVFNGRAVWVDATHGDDDSGILERRERPFQSIQAALDKIQATTSTTGQQWILYIANGLYNEGDGTGLGLQYPTRNVDITFKCASRVGTVINLNGTGIGLRRLFATGQSVRRLEIYGGTWNHNGTSVMFSNSNLNAYYYNANFNSIGTYIFFKQDTAYVEGCTAICSTGAVMSGVGGGGNQAGGQRFKNCYLEASADYIDLQVYGSTYIDSQLVSLTNGYNNTNGQGGGTWIDCIMSSQTTWLDQRGSFNITFQGVNRLVMNTNQVAIRHDSGANQSSPTQLQYSSLNIDTLIISYPLGTGTGGASIQSGSGTYLPLIVRNALISQKPPQPWIEGAVGFRIAAVPTSGNQITIDLSGNFRGIAPITYTVGASGDTLTELTNFKALIDAQVLISGTPWNLWTGGDVNKVRIQGANNDYLRVYTTEGIAGFKINATTTPYTTATAGEISQSCVVPRGTYQIGQGEIWLTPDEELWFGQGQSEVERYLFASKTRGIYTY